MHELNPQDPRPRRGSRRESLVAWLVRSAAAAGEESDELSGLDDEELEREITRETLRDRRQLRAARRAEASMNQLDRLLLQCFLLLVAVCAAAAVVVGLARGDDDLVRAGIFPLGGLSGAALYFMRQVLFRSKALDAPQPHETPSEGIEHRVG